MGNEHRYQVSEVYCEHCTCTKPGTLAHDDVIVIFSPLQ